MPPPPAQPPPGQAHPAQPHRRPPASPVSLLDRKLVFVTGKGGVGKTTVAAALALLAAGRGKRTLVCEVDAKGNLADFFETGGRDRFAIMVVAALVLTFEGLTS